MQGAFKLEVRTMKIPTPWSHPSSQQERKPRNNHGPCSHIPRPWMVIGYPFSLSILPMGQRACCPYAKNSYEVLLVNNMVCPLLPIIIIILICYVLIYTPELSDSSPTSSDILKPQPYGLAQISTGVFHYEVFWAFPLNSGPFLGPRGITRRSTQVRFLEPYQN